MPDDRQQVLGDRAVEMINLVIDGEATAQEQAEVQDLLNRSAEAREFYEAMHELAQSLNAMPSAPAPGVKDEVLAKLSSGRLGVQASRRPGLRPSRRPGVWASGSRRRVVLGVAWAAAAILLIVVAVDRLRVSVSPDQAAASMAPRDVEAWPQLARVASDNAELTIRHKGDRFALLVATEQPGSVTIRWDNQKLTLVAGGASGPVILQRRGGAAGSAVVKVFVEEQLVLRTSIQLNQ